jgi:uncharacterized protein
MRDLYSLASFFNDHPSLRVSGTRVAEDCAVIPNPSGVGHLLLASGGMFLSVLATDPWFAGYSTVMVHLADIAALGGRALAVTEPIDEMPDERSLKVFQGIQSAAQVYGLPMITEQAGRATFGEAAMSPAVIGHAGERLISSRDVEIGDLLLIVIDMHGTYQGEHQLWEASTTSSPRRLRADLEMIPSLAEKGLCRAGRRIAKGGILGSLADLCHQSKVGAVLDLGEVPSPMDVEIEEWLVSLPSYGFLLAVSPSDLDSVLSHFTATKITCREIGYFQSTPGITLSVGGERVELDGKSAGGKVAFAEVAAEYS